MSNLLLVIVGIALNFLALHLASRKEPQGLMGMGPFLLFCFIPFFVVGILLIGFVIKIVGKILGKDWLT